MPADPISPAAAARKETDLLGSEVLKPVHRACLVLRYAHGMTLTEMAHRTGLSEMEARSHLREARQLLRTKLREREPKKNG